jgi:hypothetical protein
LGRVLTLGRFLAFGNGLKITQVAHLAILSKKCRIGHNFYRFVVILGHFVLRWAIFFTKHLVTLDGKLCTYVHLRPVFTGKSLPTAVRTLEKQNEPVIVR